MVVDTNRQPQTTFAVLVNHILKVKILHFTKMSRNYCQVLTRVPIPSNITFASAPNGCLTTSLIYHGAAQGVEIDEVESILSGDLEIQGFLGMSETIRNGHESIEVTFKIKSESADRKQRN